MKPNNYIELAKTYVALSNSHNLKLIELMFVGNASYHSSYFGEFKGSPAINEMMVSFFTRFPDVYWAVSEYRLIGKQRVEFEFVMTATNAASGEHIERHGLEQIHFTKDDMISHIAVRKPDE